MKKVLVSIFIVLLSINSGYCDNVMFINDKTNSTDVMNSIISMKALLEAFGTQDNKCHELTTELKNDVSKLIAKSATQGQDITLSVIYSACISAYSNENLPTTICNNCIKDIISIHNNYLGRSIRSGELLFKSKQEYMNALLFNEKCPEHGLGETPIYAYSSKGCYDKCKERAIKQVCEIPFYLYNSKSGQCLCEYEELKKYDNDYDLHIADIVPTWKDYKKLYNIK